MYTILVEIIEILLIMPSPRVLILLLKLCRCLPDIISFKLLNNLRKEGKQRSFSTVIDGKPRLGKVKKTCSGSHH